jgi:hypothetical protein
MNISQATRKVLRKYPNIAEYLSYGVVNYRALARLIQPEVERLLGTGVKLQSIVTALRRSGSAKLEQGEASRILAKSEVSLRYDLGLITTSLSRETPRKVLEVHRALRGETYVLLQGLENLTIVTRQEHIAKLEKLFGDEMIESKRSLAGIFVKSPPEIASTSGVLARLSGLLAAEGINVVEMMSSHMETIFLVEERDCLRGVEAIREEIKRARGG